MKFMRHKPLSVDNLGLATGFVMLLSMASIMLGYMATGLALWCIGLGISVAFLKSKRKIKISSKIKLYGKLAKI